MTRFSFFSKCRSKGLHWFLIRLNQELFSPKTFPAVCFSRLLKKIVYWAIIKPYEMIQTSDLKKKSKKKDALLFIYDLAYEPITFDFIWALVAANYQRHQAGLDHLDVAIVKGPYEGVRQEEREYDESCPVSNRQYRINAILFQATAFVKTFRDLYFIERSELSDLMSAYEVRYPKYYSVLAPLCHQERDALVADPAIRCLEADPHSLQVMTKWLALRANKRKVISVTLRQSSYDLKRNSDLDAWLRLADSFDPKEYCFVFIPDTEVSHQIPQSFAQHVFCIEASISLKLRMALYELSDLCLGINNGPMALCWFSDKIRYIIFKIISKGALGAEETAIKRIGLQLDETPIFCKSKTQQWIWESDSFETLKVYVQNFFNEQPAKLIESVAS